MTRIELRNVCISVALALAFGCVLFPWPGNEDVDGFAVSIATLWALMPFLCGIVGIGFGGLNDRKMRGMLIGAGIGVTVDALLFGLFILMYG